MAFEKIQKESALDKIISQIKDQINSGDLKPGDKLPPERKLSELLGVSRAVVREAVQALSFSGYLEVIQSKGIYVTDLSIKYDEIVNFFSNIKDYSLEYLMETRIMLESEFARYATLNASKNEIRKIENIYNKIVLSKNTSNEYFIKDLEFHIYLAKMTHNPLMYEIMKVFGEMIYKETQRFIEDSTKTKEHTINTLGSLVQAIKERKAETAKQLMIEHINNIKASLEQK